LANLQARQACRILVARSAPTVDTIQAAAVAKGLVAAAVVVVAEKMEALSPALLVRAIRMGTQQAQAEQLIPA
jgi:hypothetical protein